MNCSSSIVAYGNDTRGLQQDNELLEQFFAGSPFLRVVLPVSKRISGFMRVKGKVPSISLATVYRTLQAMAAGGEVHPRRAHKPAMKTSTGMTTAPVIASHG
mgnify:CR=1 FL=1